MMVLPRRRLLHLWPLVAAGLLVLSCAAPCLVQAQDAVDPFGNDLTLNMCYSTTDLFRTSLLTIRSKPDERLVIYDFPGVAPKVEIQCLFLTEKGMTHSSESCTTTSLLWLCKAPVGENNFECEALTSYNVNPKTVITRGDSKTDHRWRIEWDAVAKSEFCYPRDVYLTMIGTSSFPNSGTVGAVIVFTIIAILVLGIVVVFGGHALKRALARKLRPDKVLQMEADLPPAIPMAEALNDLDEVEAQRVMEESHYPQPLNGSRSLHDRYPPGPGGSRSPDRQVHDPQGEGRDTFRPSGRVIIPTQASLYQKSLLRPLPFERAKSIPMPSLESPTEYTGGLPSPPAGSRALVVAEDRSIVGMGLHESAPQPPPLPMAERPTVVPSVIPPSVHRQLSGGLDVDAVALGSSRVGSRSASRSPNRQRGAVNEVLVCADCLLRIQEKDTPKFCEVTGKRHY